MKTILKKLLASVSIFALLGSSHFAKAADRDTDQKLALRASRIAYALEHGFIRVEDWLISGPLDPEKVKHYYGTGIAMTNPMDGPIDDWALGVDFAKIPFYTPIPEVKARYCDDILLLYVAEEAPQGIGPYNHRLIQRGDELLKEFKKYAKTDGRPPKITSWLEDGLVSGGSTTSTGIAVPDCMEPSTLPSGRAARIGYVKDPWKNLLERSNREIEWRQCPAGQHSRFEAYRLEAKGQRFQREGAVQYNHLGRQIGETVWGNWTLAKDLCVVDSPKEITFTVDCTFPGVNGEILEGVSWFSQQKTVTADETIVTAPVFKASTCWDIDQGKKKPVLPDPKVTSTSTRESSGASCGGGYTGSITNVRTTTVTTTTFPWEQDPIVKTSLSGWSQASNSCRKIRSSRNRGGGRDRDTPTHDADRDGVERDIDFDDSDPSIGAGGRSIGDKSQRGRNGSRGGGGSSGGSSRVICTALYQQGLMSRADWLMDLKFTKEHLSSQHINGYHAWSIPMVRLMRKSPLATRFWQIAAQARANQIAYVLGKRKTPDLLGKIVCHTLEPLCWFIGGFVGTADWRQLYLNKQTGEYSYVD